MHKMIKLGCGCCFLEGNQTIVLTCFLEVVCKFFSWTVGLSPSLELDIV